MKKNLHPKSYKVTAKCACGNTLEIMSTEKDVVTDICSGCHPFYTGQQKFIDTAGRIEKFQKKYAKNNNKKIVKK